MNGHLELVKCLCESGAIISDSAIVSASLEGHLNILKYLRRRKAYPDGISLIAASMNGHLEVVKYLLSLGITFDEDADILKS